MTRQWFLLTMMMGGIAMSSASSSRTGTIAAGAGVPARDGVVRGHVKPLPPFVAKREKERVVAADLVARGLASPDANGIVTLRNGRFVNYRLQGTAYLTTALIDFTDLQHGQIPQPDRSIDNSTYWSADVSPQHYHDLLFTPGGGATSAATRACAARTTSSPTPGSRSSATRPAC